MQFSELRIGEEFRTDIFSDPGNLILFKKVGKGDELIEHHDFLLGVGQRITRWGNAERKTDGLLFKFSPEDKVFPA